MYIGKMPRSIVRSSDHEVVRKVQHEFGAMWQAWKDEFDMLFQAWRFFFGWPEEAWTKEGLRAKKERMERAAQYNLVAPKISILHGAILADEYDFKFDPITRRRSRGIEAVENAYYCDKEICDYDKHYSRVVLDGLVHLGVLEPIIRRDVDPRGNIGFRRAIPGRWVFDRYWKTDDDKECMKGAKHGYMTAKMLVDTFRKLPYSPKLDEELMREKKKGMQTWTAPRIDEYNTHTPTFEGAWQVIEYHYVEHVRKERIIAHNAFGDVVVFPVTDSEMVLQKYAVENEVADWRTARVLPYDDYVDNIYTVCPELFPTGIIEKGKPEIQIGGIPAIQFTAERDISGRNKGVVMDLIDPARDVNYAKSKIQTYLANALGGAGVYDKSMIPNPSDQEDFEKNHNDPNRVWGINGDIGRFFSTLRDANVNPELIRQIGESIDLMDRLSNVTAAMHAQTESANEPAALFAMRLRQSRVGMRGLDDRVRYLRKRMAEAYYAQAQISYAGEERTFTSRDGKRQANLNEEIYQQGMLVGIRNKVDELPRVSVTITEAQNNLTKQMRDRTEIAAILESVPETYREVIALAIGEMVKSTAVSSDIKGKFESAIDMEVIKGKIQNIMEIERMNSDAAQSRLMGTNAVAQIQQLVSQLQPQETPEDIPEDFSPARTPINTQSPMMENAETVEGGVNA